MPRALPSLLLLVLLGSGSVACVRGPLNGAPALASTTTLVKFEGYALNPGDVVTIEGSTNGATGWSTIATAYASTSPTTFWDGTQLYYFTVSSVVSSTKWAPTSCTESETFVRFRVGLINLPTFDHKNLSGVHPATCIQQQQALGANFFPALAACDSPDSPVIRMTAAADNSTGSHFGNVVIDDPSDLVGLECKTTVYGNLTIAGPYGFDVSLPVLERVTGNLSVSYPRQAMTSFPDVRAPELPALTTVQGDLILDSPASEPSQVVSIPFGMNALNAVWGDITLTVDTFNYDGSGFDSLLHQTGNLTVITGPGDSYGVFRRLQSVVGDVFLDVGHNTGNLLTDLQVVDGNLTFAEGNPTPSTLPNLTTVSGDLTLEDVSWNGPPGIVMTALTSIGGRFTVQNGFVSALGFGAPAYSASALTLSGNSNLSTVNYGNLQIVGAGSIEVTNNPSLCLSEINAFLGSMTSWSGTSNVSGNDDGC